MALLGIAGLALTVALPGGSAAALALRVARPHRGGWVVALSGRGLLGWRGACRRVAGWSPPGRGSSSAGGARAGGPNAALLRAGLQLAALLAPGCRPRSAALLLLVVHYLAVLIPGVPAQVGLFHYVTVLALEVYAVGPEQAMPYAVVLHGLVYGTIIAAGALAAPALSLDLGALPGRLRALGAAAGEGRGAP